MGTEKQGRGGWRGGVRPKGINQTSRPFKLNNDLLEFYNSFSNKNALLNKLLYDYRDAKSQQIGGLAITQRENKTLIQDISSGELVEVDNYELELALRKLL